MKWIKNFCQNISYTNRYFSTISVLCVDLLLRPDFCMIVHASVILKEIPWLPGFWHHHYLHSFLLHNTKNVAMATKMIHLNSACREHSNGESTTTQGQIEVAIKWFECLILVAPLTFSLPYAKNVSTATMKNYFVTALKDLSRGASPNFLSKIEVEINFYIERYKKL